MMNSRNRIASLLLLAGFVLPGVSGCIALQQRIEPYPDGAGAPPAEHRTEPSLPPTGQGQHQAGQGGGGPAGTPPVTPPKELLPLLTQVDDRIAAYEEKLRGWEEFRAEADRLGQAPELADRINGCQEQAGTLLARYNQLHELLLRAETGPAAEAAAAAQLQVTSREDIAFLEGECLQLMAGGQHSEGALAATAAGLLAEGEQAIAAGMAASDYARVIDLYEKLPRTEGQKPSFAAVQAYGQALLRSGREDAAAGVIAALLAEIQQQNQVGREFELMQLMADIQFGREEYSSAFAGYVNIINRYAGLGENIEWARKQQAVISARGQQADEVTSFAEVLRAHLTFNQARDGYKMVLLAERFLARFPESTVTPTVNRLLFEARDRAEAWFAASLEQVRQLRDGGNYDAALQTAQALLRQALPPERQAQLQALADEMGKVQAQQVAEQRTAQEAALQETWRKAEDHLQMKQYSQAIAVFASLENTPYAEQAKAQIRETANLAAQEDRQRAAELFVQAGEAKDQATRVALLQQSRQLLQNILVRYPQTELLGKVRKNLERIEQDLRAIDPALLDNPPPAQGQTGGQPLAPPQGATTLQVGELQVQAPTNPPSPPKMQE